MLRFSLLVAAGVAGVVAGMLTKPKRRTPCFSIKRTKSELGYTFWILKGFGRYKCFVLCDTWQEAIDEANARLERKGTAMPSSSSPASSKFSRMVRRRAKAHEAAPVLSTH